MRSLQRIIDGLASEIRDAVDAAGTTLREIDGIGHLTAADVRAEVGEPARFRTNAAFSMANGTAPIETSSGRVRLHPLNRGGDGQTNKAIHTAPLSQIAHHHTEGCRFYERCYDRGKTKREAIRAPQRRILGRIWTCRYSAPLP